MADLGVDFSFDKFTGAQLKAAGFTFVARYLASSAGKRLTAGEISDFQANDLDIVLVWEDEATAALGGFNQGQHDAQVATEQANALGIPDNISIYLAVDFDINDAQKPTAGEYFKGAESVSSRFRAGYGGYYLIKYLFDNGLIDYGWQTVAWSGGQVDPRAHIYQNGQSTLGGGADIDEARQPNFGQWPAGGNVSTIATQEIVDSLAHAYLNDDLADNPGLQFYVGQPVEAVIAAFNDAPERAAYLKQIADWQAEAAKVPVTVTASTKPLPHLTPGPFPSNGQVVPPQKPIGPPKQSFWQLIWHTLVG